MLSEADARCCAALWLLAICVRGPILYLHELRVNTWRWSRGAAHGKFGPALMAAFWCTLAYIAFPGSPLLLALASGLTAVHQVRAARAGVVPRILIEAVTGMRRGAPGPCTPRGAAFGTDRGGAGRLTVRVRPTASSSTGCTTAGACPTVW